jgi:hypothetical protein
MEPQDQENLRCHKKLSFFELSEIKEIETKMAERTTNLTTLGIVGATGAGRRVHDKNLPAIIARGHNKNIPDSMGLSQSVNAERALNFIE